MPVPDFVLRLREKVGDDESVAVGWFAPDELPEMDPVLVERTTTAVAHQGTTRLH